MVKRGVTIDTALPAGQQFSPIAKAELDVLYGGNSTGNIPVEAFGAHGDGSDDTAAFQALVAELQANGGRGVYDPRKNYVINEPMVIDTAGGNWSLRGGRITQNANGQPIFDFVVENVHDVDIDAALAWANPQTPAMGTAAIRFDNGGTNTAFLWYAMTLNIRLINAHDGIVTRDISGHKNGLWDSRIRVKAGYGSTGTPVRLGSGTVGQTGLDIDVYAHRETSAEPVVKLVIADAPTLRVKMDGENQSAANGIVLEACTAVQVTGRQERGSLADGDAVISLQDCQGVDINFGVQAIQSFSGARQSVVKCLKGDYAGAAGTSGVTLHGAYSTYDPQPSAPASMRTAYVDDGSAPLAEDSFVLQGAMGRATPTNKQPATGGTGGTPAARSITGSQIAVGTILAENIAPGVITGSGGGGGGGAPIVPRQTIMGLGHSLIAPMPLYNPSLGVNSHLNGSGGHGPGDYLEWANLMEGSPLDNLGAAATAGYTVQQIRDTWLPVVLAAKPGFCIVWAPCANNILAGGEFNANGTLDVEKYIYDQLVANGIRPIMATLPPAANSSNSGFTQNEMLRYSAWATDYATANHFELLDYYTAMVDPATGSYRVGEAAEDRSTGVRTHPGDGAWRLIDPLRRLIRKIATRDGAYFLPGFGAGLTSPYATARADNPMMAGTLGGNLPSGWTSSGVTFNLTAATFPNLGNILTITSTGAFGYVSAPLLNGSPGNKWDWAMRWATRPAAGGGFGVQVYDQNGNQRHNWGHPTLPNPNQLTLDKPFHARGKFDSGVSQLKPLIFVVGAGSQMDICQYGLTNLSALGVGL